MMDHRGKTLVLGLLVVTQYVESQSTTTLATTNTNTNTDLGSSVNDPFAVEEQQEQQLEKCVPCQDNQIDETKSFDGLTCSEWLEFARQIPANTEECALERLLGWKYCGCPAQTEEICTFCEGGEDELTLGRQLPFSTISCEAFIDVPAIDGDMTCSLASDFSYCCGCNNVQPKCTMCEDGMPPKNLDAPLYLGMTCRDVQDLYLVSSESRCVELQNEYPFDIQAYCGCNNTHKLDTTSNGAGCPFCPYGGVLRNTTQTLLSDETSTCGDWATLAEYAKEGEDFCATFQYVGLECCDDMTLPDFFNEYYAEDGDDPADDADLVATEMPDVVAVAGEPVTDVDQADTQEDPNSIAIPFVEPLPTVSTDGLSDDVHKCFQEHTELISDKVTAVLDSRAVSGLNQTAITEVADTVRMDKFAKLIEDLHNVTVLPDNFNSMVPDNEFLNHTFLPGLSTCLASAIKSRQLCFLCENGVPPTKPDKMIPIVGLYCSEYDAWRAETYGDACKSMDSWLPFDMASFCGCPGVPDPPITVPATTSTLELENAENANKECSFCPEGMVMVMEAWKKKISNPSILDGYSEESTCTQWFEMDTYATSLRSCSLLHKIGSAGCCEPMGESILDTAATNAVDKQPTFEPTFEPVTIIVSSAASLRLLAAGLVTSCLTAASFLLA